MSKPYNPTTTTTPSTFSVKTDQLSLEVLTFNKMSAAIQHYLCEYKVPNTNVYAIPMDKYKSLYVKQWKYNRPPDMTRIPEIHSWMSQFRRMDGVLNLAYIHGDGLVCFEGNHRRIALEGLNIPVLVDIVWDATDDIVRHEFFRLNKAVSVPELYVSDTPATMRVEIEDAVAQFRKKYSSMESTSGKPQRPNYNRDKLTDELMRLQKELVLSVGELMNRLYALNESYASKDKSKLTEKMRQKCEASGLWLFAWSASIPTKDLQ
jgi:hypothetical protein